MKIRNGFVSNSSSSSFICNIYEGKKKLNIKEIKEIIGKIFDMYDETYGKRNDDIIERNKVKVIEIKGKKYKGKYKGWDIEEYILSKIKDEETYIEIYDEEDNVFRYPLQEIIGYTCNAYYKHLG